MTAGAPELRTDPLSGRQVVIAPARADRPGAEHGEAPPDAGDTHEGCPFCEGREAATPPETLALGPPGRAADAPGWRVRVVPNKFPALGPWVGERRHGLLCGEPARGRQEVVIHSPRHVLSVSDLSGRETADVAQAWIDRAEDARADGFAYIHVTLNEGARAGATLAHSHSQLYALPAVPPLVQEEPDGVAAALLDEERARRTRIVLERERLVAYCPFASRFPYEVTIAPVDHATNAFDGAILPEAVELVGEALRRVRSVVGWVSANAWIVSSALDGSAPAPWRLVVAPRLTIPAGLELGIDLAINPVAPETAAGLLRDAVT